MAISYITDLSETEFLFSHNNNVIEFFSDSIQVVSNCVITINGNDFILYPTPEGSFYFNFKEVVSALINKVNYADDLNTDIDTSYTYSWSDRVYLFGDIDITINFLNESTDTDTKDLHFLLSSVNLRDYNQRYPYSVGLSETLLALPFVDKSNNSYYAKYWTGYPFDVTVLKGIGYTEEITVENTTNALSYAFPSAGVGNFERLVFSDGRSSATIEDVLPLVDGYNNLTISTASDAFLQLEKTDGCEGVYLKWLNDNGGYSYWLFNFNEAQRKYKQLGYLKNDYNNLQDTTSQEVSLGYDSNDSLKVYEDGITENQKNLIKSMLDSPKVYLFTGTPYSQNNFNDWMEVKLRQSNYVLKQVKRNSYNIALSFELPNNYNITV